MSESLIDNLPDNVNDIQAEFRPESSRPLRILVLSAVFPSSVDPTHGVFVKERVKAVAALPDCEVRVIAPIPWFPPIKRFSRWYKWSQFPREEIFEGLKVYRPRYFLPPKLGGYIHPTLMYPVVKQLAKRIRAEFPFDLIDSHFVYPAGVVGTMLGKRYNVPVVMTGRGMDMLKFPDMPFKGKSIRWALQNGSRFVGVSNEIAAAMRTHGAAPEHVSVIPNGIAIEKFQPLPQADCRMKLGLPTDRQIILSVGDRLELKGFHLLIEAMPEILKAHANAYLVIVGGGGRYGRDYTAEIEDCIKRHDMKDHVILAGGRPHEELPLWYNAADLFALMSSREGSPNVLLEALACGTPAVGTPVGGIADELVDPLFGRLLPERTSSAAASVITELLTQTTNRVQLHSAMSSRSWNATARRCITVYGETHVQSD